GRGRQRSGCAIFSGSATRLDRWQQRYIFTAILEAGPQTRPAKRPSRTDSIEASMLESRSWWPWKTSGNCPGRPSRTLVVRPPKGEKSMARPIRLCLFVLFVLASALGAVGLVAPTTAEAQKKVLNIAAKEPDTLDPHSSTLGQSQAIARFMFRGLTRFAIKDGKVTTAEVEPDLAESWTLSPEGTIWTFKLRKGVQFHKGFGEMTAEDVKFSLERQINKTPGTRYGVNL